jgi:hypothetical protein
MSQIFGYESAPRKSSALKTFHFLDRFFPNHPSRANSPYRSTHEVRAAFFNQLLIHASVSQRGEQECG